MESGQEHDLSLVRSRRPRTRRGLRQDLPDSSVDAVHLAPGGFPSEKKGTLTVEFTVMGIPCLGLNGGPAFAQRSILVSGRHRRPGRNGSLLERTIAAMAAESACGWCKDKWGLSWQITPIALTKAITDPDPAAAARVRCDDEMTKIDIAASAARRG
jgi:2-polyprenyl-6-hydroxyphenyl methylase/3-demethylubiquinone-9 3-methyltransferase